MKRVPEWPGLGLSYSDHNGKLLEDSTEMTERRYSPLWCDAQRVSWISVKFSERKA